MTAIRDLTDLLDLMGPDEQERWDERMAIKTDGAPQRLEQAAAECIEEMKGGERC